MSGILKNDRPSRKINVYDMLALWGDAIYHGYEDSDGKVGASRYFRTDDDLLDDYLKSFPRLAKLV